MTRQSTRRAPCSWRPAFDKVTKINLLITLLFHPPKIDLDLRSDINERTIGSYSLTLRDENIKISKGRPPQTPHPTSVTSTIQYISHHYQHNCRNAKQNLHPKPYLSPGTNALGASAGRARRVAHSVATHAGVAGARLLTRRP